MRSTFCLMKPFLMLANILAALAGLSCSRDYSSIVMDWQEEGWQEVEEFGPVGDYLHYTELRSDRALAVEASWVVEGERKTKLYEQGSKSYLVLHFERADGDVFAVVMSKRR